MEYSNEPMEFKDPSIGYKIFGACLFLVALAIIGHLINMTFFYVPAPNETPLEGWNLFGGWALGMVLSLLAAFFGLGAWLVGAGGAAYESKDPKIRIMAIETGELENEVLIRMAMSDPVDKVSKAAIKAAPMQKLYAAYDHCDNSGMELRSEVRSVVETHRRKTLLKKAQTLSGFKSLGRQKRSRAIEQLPLDLLKNHFPGLGDIRDQEEILDRIPAQDLDFLREVASNEKYANDVRIKAARQLPTIGEYAIFFASQDKELRTFAVDHMRSTGDYSAELAKHLPNENDETLCRDIVHSIGEDMAFSVLNNNPSFAAGTAIIDACSDLEKLRKVEAIPGLNAAFMAKADKRIKQLEADVVAAQKQAQARKERKQAAKKKAEGIATSTDEVFLFTTIEDLREKRTNRLTATERLAKLRPANKLAVQPGTQMAWHCPECSVPGDVVMKPTNWETMEAQMERGGFISGGVNCPKCGTGHTLTDILSGDYDVVMVNISCPHCDNPMAGPIDSWINCECMSCGKMVLQK